MNAYLIFHSLAELFSVIVAWGILTVALNSRRFLKHSFFLFLGVAYAAVGTIDLVHTLTYEGMGVFAGLSSNQPTQLWIASRYLNAVSLLLAPFFLTRRVRIQWIVPPYVIVTILLLAAVFTGWFPDSYRENPAGLTAFKIISEYIICTMIVAAMVFLWRRRILLDRAVLRLLLISMALMIATEVAFTEYVNIYGFVNILGHLLKIAAFGVLYQAIVVMGLRRPYEVLFDDLRLSEQRYRNLVTASPDAIVVYREGQLLYANAAALVLYGAADFKALAARTTESLIAPTDRAIVEGHIDRAMTGQNIAVHEIQILRLDGQPVPVEARFSSIEYAGSPATQMILRDLSERLKAEKSLQQHNEEMRKSRAATLNLLQDAIIAREQAEEASRQLRQEIAEREQAEEALRKSKQESEFLADLIKSSSQALGIGYPDGRLGLINPAFERLTGYTAEELKSLDWAEKLTPSEWRDIEKQKLEQLNRTGKPIRYEKEYLRKDGTRVPIELLVHLIKDAEGNPEYYYSFISDITDRKRAEEVLRQNRRDLNHAQSVGNIGSWRLDVKKNELFWSDENYRIFGIPKGTALTYETFLSAIHPDDREYVNARWKAALTDGEYDIEHRIIVDGKTKWVREKANLERNDKGELISGFGITQDITHRKLMQEKLRQAYEQMEMRVRQRTAELADTVESLGDEVRQRIAAEKALKESEEKYRHLIEVSPEAVCLVVDEKIEYSNTAALKLIGAENFEDFNGRSVWDFVRANSAGIVRNDIEDIIKRNKKIPSREITLVRMDGMPVEVEISAVGLWQQGKPGILAVFHDITERKRIQEQTRMTNVLLEQFTKKALRKEYLDSLVEIIRDWSGCYAVGIRLTDANGWIPYESHVGFSDDFLATEDRISLREGHACLCIRAITQNRESSDEPLVTQRGSFHSVNTPAFFKTLSDEEKKRYRGNCARHGFATLVVVPIRYQDEIIGVIHLADKEKNKITTDSVAFLENMAMLVGEAVHRFTVEESLKASRLRLLEAQRIAHIGNWQWDIKNGGMICSDEIYRILGLEPGQREMTYDEFLSYIHPEDREILRETVAIALNTGQFTLDHRIVTADGRLRVAQEKAEVTCDNDGNPVTMAGIMLDITDQKQAEQAIREYQRTLRSMAAELHLVEERERRQIAQDLHDSIGPILAFSTRELQSLKKNAPPEIAAVLQDVAGKMDVAIQQARTLSFDLSPSLLYDLGFEVAIEDLVDRFADERKIPCRFQTCPQSKPLSEDVKIVLYRSVRELMINAAKHAEASFLKVSVDRVKSSIRVIVQDDGEGFDVRVLEKDSNKEKGFGLFSIRERLTHIGGMLEIDSVVGRGTTVVLTAPLDMKNENQ